jgi:tetratricopeptide (TPR) repeat protein
MAAGDHDLRGDLQRALLSMGVLSTCARKAIEMGLKTRTVVSLLVVLLTIPGMAMAVNKGRLVGIVLDPEGNPVEGVKVIATCSEVSSFNETDTTDDKGAFKINFDYVGVVYTLAFSKDGYLPFTSNFTLAREGKKRESYVMHPGDATVESVVLDTTSEPAIEAYNAGVAAFNRTDYETAVAKLEEAVGHDPSLFNVWEALSRVKLSTEDYQGAVEAAEKAIELGATGEAVWRWRWQAYKLLGDEEKTVQALKDLKDAGLQAAEAQRLHNEAVALTRANDYEGAYALFKQALELDPNLSSALLGTALAALEIGRYGESLDATEALLESDPDNERAIRLRYNAALEVGDTDRIMDALVDLAKVEPEIARTNLLAMAFESYDANDMVESEKRFRKVLQVDPNHPHSHYLLALIYVNDERVEEAKYHLERFIALAPDDPEAPTATELLRYLNQS